MILAPDSLGVNGGVEPVHLPSPGAVNATRTATGTRPPSTEFDLGRIFTVAMAAIRPAPVNDAVYTAIDRNDPGIIEMARQMADPKVGQLEPVVLTTDNVILSGHRRYAARKRAGLKDIQARVFPIASIDPRFTEFLVNFNSQREKRPDEVFREELVRLAPAEARRRLVEHRRQAVAVNIETMTISGVKTRAVVSEAKAPFLEAICAVVERLRDYWPLSDRLIHYQLLNRPPLKHASKPGSRYVNDERSYKALTELLTRARLNGTVPHEAIHDPTRPVTSWNVFPGVREFVKTELKNFLQGYWRDLQRSQPIHIEIVGEKNTIQSILSPVAAEYTIPFTIGRGYSSIPPRKNLVRRFQRSRKDKLLLLFVSDYDPEGDDIAHSFARSIRDDFGVKCVEAVKVALTREQADELALPATTTAKAGSSRRKGFVDAHGSDTVWELEAVPPDRLQMIIREHIESVLDMDLFRQEEEREADDATELDEICRRMRRYMTTNFADLDAGDAKDSTAPEFEAEGGDA